MGVYFPTLQFPIDYLSVMRVIFRTTYNNNNSNNNNNNNNYYYYYYYYYYQLQMGRHPVAVVILHITYVRTMKVDYSRFS
jgi:hypothetical protein